MTDSAEHAPPWWRSSSFQRVGTYVVVVGWIGYCAAMATRGGWLAIAGAAGVVSAAGLWWTQFGRWHGGPPVANGSGTLLPRRPGNIAAGLILCLLHPLTATVLGISALSSGDGRSPWAWGMVLTAPFILVVGIGIAVGWARGRARLRLTPAGMEYLPIWGRHPVAVPWASISSVTSDGSVGNGVFVFKGATRVAVWTGGVGVRPETLIALLNWYATHPADRGETTAPESVGARARVLADRAVMSG